MSNRRAHMVPPVEAMGISARPIGVYQIKGDLVTWVPAVDVSRIV